MTVELTQARDSLDRHLVELECLTRTLNLPEDAPDIAFVLDCMVARLRDQWEQFQSLIGGGMGVITPMVTNPVAPIDSVHGRDIGPQQKQAACSE